ncbi:RrF2 family transcriptional regulator [Commensalibacter oyaizuii]|uniref:Rrf2 family transcriptional regulator n=1 Tax=Commensalibacter oyaizuii TaxID=3043873 RepID=A0ABT6Q0M6_9PROT|nr:Rrf2 family transcriptional regulator [Commensalibacter sp. TBRC 16381]MDI2090528.1 Rrf2 family transcriptional regulator [Commensalibacter sp. TBRC 16381]
MLLRQDRAVIAILIVTDIAFYSSRNNTVSAADISTRTDLPKRSIEPILQLLSKASILESTRGPHGGYHLARPKRLITLAHVIQAISVQEKEKYTDITFSLYTQIVKPFWDEIDQKALKEASKITLQDLVKKAEQKGMKRPRPTPIYFTI